jgi:hypothetical protein
MTTYPSEDSGRLASRSQAVQSTRRRIKIRRPRRPRRRCAERGRQSPRTHKQVPAPRDSLNKHALMILGSALIPEIWIAITHGDAAAVPTFPVVRRGSSLGQMRPMIWDSRQARDGFRKRNAWTYEYADDVEHEDADVHAADGARDVLGGVARLCGGHAEDFRAELRGYTLARNAERHSVESHARRRTPLG